MRFLFAALAGIILGVPTPALAWSLSAQPAIVKVSVEAGSEWRGGITLTNPSAEPMVLEVGTLNLMPPPREGAPAVPITDETKREREASLAGWIEHPGTLRLEAGETVTMPVTLAVPDFAGAGRHFAALTFTPQGALAAPTMTVGIALDVVGQDERSLALAGFSLRRLFPSFPESVHVTLRNTGSTVSAVSGHLAVSDFLRRRTAEVPMPVPGEERYLIPGATADYRLATGGGGWGVYRAQLTVAAGVGTLEEGRYFLVFPWPVLAALLVAGFAVVAGAGVAVRVLRRRLSTER